MSEKLHAPETPRLTIFAANALYLVTCVGLFLFSLLGGGLMALLSRLLPGAGAEGWTLAFNLLFYGLMQFLPVAWLLRRTDAWDSMRIKPLPPMEMLLVAVTALVGLRLMTDLGALWSMVLSGLGLTLQDSSAIVPTDTRGLVLGVFSIAVLPGVCEELVMRGAIMSAWERKGTRRAILMSALLFMLMHGTVEGLPVQFLLGVVLGVIVFATESIYAGIAYHTVHNAASLIVSYLYSGVTETEERMLLARTDLFAYAGGWSAVLSLALDALMLGALMLLLLRGFLRRAKLRKIAPLLADGSRMTRAEWALLLVALVPVALFYFSDLARMLGGIG